MAKRLLLALMAALTGAAAAMAIPAHRQTVSVTQPDGTQLTLQLVGDEWNHYYRTTDGYTLAKDSRGCYTYARLNAAQQLVPTTQAAHDESQRTAREQLFLAGIGKHLAPSMLPQTARQYQREMQERQRSLHNTQARSLAARQDMNRQATLQAGDRRNTPAAADGRHRASSSYSNFRGLIILIEYSDLAFSRDDYPDILADMVGKENYTGYTSTNGRKQTYVGSVRDYFYDNSNGLFNPQFDVVGPVQVSYSQYTPNGSKDATNIFRQAVNRADSLVDFSQYDGDGDGEVDMIYFIVPGYSSSYGGNDERLLWPHAWSLYTSDWQYIYKDGVRMGRYACSTEMYGWSQYEGNQNYACIDGIGTICHEFSHVLGIMDHYDTDYEANGESFHPGEWDVMAGGAHGDRGRQPVGYSLYEKTAMGFTEPVTASHGEDITLELLDTSHNGLRIPSGEKREVFYLESRDKSAKWGKYLPGQGLLVWRIDSTNVNMYSSNTLNCDPKHNYVEIVRAHPSSQQNSGGDTFPGTYNVTELTNITQPANLLSWTGKECNYELEDIRRAGTGVSFTLIDLSEPHPARYISLSAEAITIGTGLTYQLEATIKPASHTSTVTWSTSNRMVASVSNSGLVRALRAGACFITVTTDNGLSASCAVTVEDETPCANVGEFLTLPDSTCVRLTLNNAQVLFRSGNSDLYLRDVTGAVVMHGTGVQAQKGQVFNGSVYCMRHTASNGMPQLLFVEGRSDTDHISVTEGEDPQPLRVAIEELGQQHLGQLVDVWGYQIEQKVKLGSVTRTCLFVQADQDTRLYLPIYNNFSLSKTQVKNAAIVDGHYYAAVGIVWPFTRDNDHDVSYELSLTEGFRDITDDPEWTAGITTVVMDRSQDTRIYDLRGIPQQQLRRGINIVGKKKIACF